MADLSIDFAGIRSPNPCWLASAPPKGKECSVRHTFEGGHGGVEAPCGHRHRRGRLVPGSALCGRGGRYRVRAACLALSLLAAPAVADIRAGTWCDPGSGPPLHLDADGALGFGDSTVCRWTAPPLRQARALSGRATCATHAINDDGAVPIDARDIRIALTAISDTLIFATLDDDTPRTLVWCGV